MKTTFEQIIDLSAVGKLNTKSLNEVLTFARKENLRNSSEDEKRVLLLGIDIQNDFMEGGALGVPGSIKDVQNLLHFTYENIEKITDIIVSLDTHQPMQIFHPSWWVNELGENPSPLTIISYEDVKQGKWKPVTNIEESLDYVMNLEKIGKKQLCIWPYHCIEGTFGCSLESQFSNLVYFHSVARSTNPSIVVKGLSSNTEMYGIFKPEYSSDSIRNDELLKKISEYDQIIIAGEAKSHCVLESLLQLIEYFEEEKLDASKIVILEDCMSSIPGFEESTEETFRSLQQKFGIQLVNSTEYKI